MVTGQVRLGWGLAATSAATASTMVVVVDVLSFSTTVSVAVEAGIQVYPYRWRDGRADAFAREVDAELAHGRRHSGISLSPASIRRSRGVQRLVLPSPNGSTISQAVADSGAVVVAGCLRNAAAVGAELRRWVSDPARSALVIAAGEHWPDGTVRRAAEDFWGAGAVLSHVAEPSSPPVAAYFAVADRLGTALADCTSGRELIGYGFAEDVAIAAEADASGLIPLLIKGCYRPS